MTTDTTLEYVRYVATKFGHHIDRSWVATDDLGGLEHIRYTSDHTGRLSLKSRIKLAVTPNKTLLSLNRLVTKNTGVRRRVTYTVEATLRRIRRIWKLDDNLPDALVGRNIFHWSEEAEYVTAFGPSVGVLILDFLEDQPDNPHAIKILEEMTTMVSRMSDNEEGNNE